MRYQILVLNVPNRVYSALKQRFGGMDVDFTTALTPQQASTLCIENAFHLIILNFPDFTVCSSFFIALRRDNRAPAIALMDQYDIKGACDVLQSGADLCLGTEWPVDWIVDHMMAQFRRYTSYNCSADKKKDDKEFFEEGDIYLDPKRGIVRVRGKDIKLNRREFLLLLYFMKHPKDILSTEQICTYAWGNEGSYERGISGPISNLRKAIEPDPANPIYIKTKKMYGYYFAAYKSETCDICSDPVGLL